jgi:AraC-like DNA-binding protein
VHESVQHAISIINKRFDEPLTLRILASENFFSPFHFSRLFHKETGITPSGYLRAVRLFQAKRLLTITSLAVADVVTAVGYSSVGTFTTRFTQATGLSPSQFREEEVADLLIAAGPGLRKLPSYEQVRALCALRPRPDRPTGSIVGSVRIPEESTPADVLIGVFDSLVPQGSPVACQAMTGVGTPEVFIQNVPTGKWFVIAMAMPTAGRMQPETLVLGGTRDPVTITAGQAAGVDLKLCAPSPTDPPFAVAATSRRGRKATGPAAAQGQVPLQRARRMSVPAPSSSSQ